VFDPNYSSDILPTNLIILLDASDPENPVRLGYISSPAIQITTAVQIDQSGNVWTVNNWSLDSQPGAIIGGDGLIKFIGLGSPTAAPLIGSPVDPAVGSNVGFVSHTDDSPGNSRGYPSGDARPTSAASPPNAWDEVFSNYSPSPTAADFVLPDILAEEESDDSDASLAVAWQELPLGLDSLFNGSFEDSPFGKPKGRGRS
jgi:hypothetical protein